VRWRLYDSQLGWRSEWPSGQNLKAPLALEMQVSAGRFEAIRRVLLLPGGLR
jgi:general secretion pathway protein J